MGNIPGMPELNPQSAAALLNSPVVQEMLTQISSNPELFRTLVESSPLLQPMVVPFLHNYLLNLRIYPTI